MGRLSKYANSSVGKKQLLAVTGLSLSLFLLAHMAGNLLLLVGADAYNAYGHALVSNKLIYVAEAGLVAFFLLHFVLAIRLTLENRSARPQGYAVAPGAGRGATTMASRSMILSGLVIFVFAILHLFTFKFGVVYSTNVGGVEMRDLYLLATEIFHQPVYVGWYVFSLLVLWAHLTHGISSAIQTFGWNHPSYWCGIRCGGAILAAVICLGFMGPPIYLFLRG